MERFLLAFKKGQVGKRLLNLAPGLFRMLEALEYSGWNREYSFRNRRAFKRTKP